ncbi:MAG: CDP-alcohol phosphatidyltransferase family protein [Acidobacteriia bacterium]|nr:CDP-alcohol phosphatidyltransferase family protein [Terriglobia bacterium]
MPARNLYFEYSDLGGAAAAQLSDSDRKELGFKTADRMHEAITARVEKRALVWMAAHMPARINSDHLTALGFVAQFLAGATYALARFSPRWLIATNFFIALNWLGDSLDGTLARVRNQQRPRYGFYVDHVIDTFGAAFLMGGLALSGYLHWAVALAMLVAFLMLSVEVYLTTYTLGQFKLSYGKFGPTEIRIALCVGNIALMYRPWAHLFGFEVRLFDVGGAIATAAMLGIMVVSTIQHAKRLYREERLG